MKKIVLGIMLFMIGLAYSAITFVCATLINRTSDIIRNLEYTGMKEMFFTSLFIMIVGIILVIIEIFSERNENIKKDL